MPREISENEPDAFMYWAGEAGKSIPKVARDLGIADSTVRYWHKAMDWEGQYQERLRELAAGSIETGINELKLGVSAAARRLVKMLNNDDTPDNEQRENIRLYFDLLRGSFTNDNSPASLTLIDARSIMQHSTDQLDNREAQLSAAARAIEARVIDANESAKPGRRRTF